jgi:hypothetical protein
VLSQVLSKHVGHAAAVVRPGWILAAIGGDVTSGVAAGTLLDGVLAARLIC